MTDTQPTTTTRRGRGPNSDTSRRQIAFLALMRSMANEAGGEMPTIGQLARRLGRSKSSVHGMLTRLQKRGLVRRNPDVDASRWEPNDETAAAAE